MRAPSLMPPISISRPPMTPGVTGVKTGYTNKASVISKIASVTIKGYLYGTAGGTDSCSQM